MQSATTDTIWDESRLAAPHAQPDKSRRVQAMFNAIAPTYELVNRVLSAGRDAHWRRQAVRLAKVAPTDRILDLACGTGDFAREFQRASPALVVGSDFASGMLALAAARDDGRIPFCQGDAHHLPFRKGSFNIVSCAFGVRNFQELAVGLGEIYRVLQSGGRAVILEFTMPKSKLIGGAYRFYFRRILPRVARIISRDRSGAYDYLPNSVASFIDDKGMIAALRNAGFHSVVHRAFTVGIVTVYVATKQWND